MISYLVITPDGRTYGPAYESQLIQWAREGRVIAETRLECRETGQKLTAAGLPSLGLVPVGSHEPVMGPPPVPPHQPHPPAVGWAGLAVNMPGAFPPHGLEECSVPLLYLLTLLTFGIYPFFHFNLMHGRLPKVRPNDPSAGRAIGFHFIPVFNVYWAIFVQLRLADRVNEQRRLAGLPESGTKGFLITALVMSLIPLLNIAGVVLLWTYHGLLQASVNELVRRSRRSGGGVA